MTGQSFTSVDMKALERLPYANAVSTWLVFVLRLFFSIVLLITGVAKLLDIDGFAAIVDSYAVLPAVLTTLGAWILALTEIALAAWLFSARKLRLAAAAVVAMHAMYLVWLLLALARGLSIPNCGCFGVYWGRPLTWQTPLEDAILLGFAILLWRAARPTILHKHA